MLSKIVKDHDESIAEKYTCTQTTVPKTKIFYK